MAVIRQVCVLNPTWTLQPCIFNVHCSTSVLEVRELLPMNPNKIQIHLLEIEKPQYAQPKFKVTWAATETRLPVLTKLLKL